jgi:hypothetical protein
MGEIRTSFQRAAWQFFGLTGGTHVVRSYRYYNNAVACDDGWPADEFACAGGGCQVCLSPGAGGANYNGLGKITLYRNGGGGAQEWLQGGNVIVHEFGHMYAGHNPNGDEYQDVSGTDRSACQHTWMSQYGENAFTFCTPANQGGSDPERTRSGMRSGVHGSRAC